MIIALTSSNGRVTARETGGAPLFTYQTGIHCSNCANGCAFLQLIRNQGGSLAHTSFPNALTQATYAAGNELTSWDALVPTYNADGEMTTDVNGNQYTWNARNQLTAVSGANSASFGYDAFGRWISKTIGASSVSFQYDGLNRVAETSGGATAWLLPGSLDIYFQRSDSNGNTVPLTDALGSTIGMTDGTGSLLTTYWYDPFGATTVGGAANGNSTQFAGRENDGSGLYYYRARYYNPQIGRFISEDPIGLDGGLDEYAYVTDSPLSFIDPLGNGSSRRIPWIWRLRTRVARLGSDGSMGSWGAQVVAAEVVDPIMIRMTQILAPGQERGPHSMEPLILDWVSPK